MSDSNPIESANKAKFVSDVSTYRSDLALTILNKYSQSKGMFDASTLNLDKNNGIKEYIKSMRIADLDKFCVVSGELKLVKGIASTDEEKWFEEASVIPLPSVDPNYDLAKGVNKPKLAGMKPITIANNGTVTVVEPTNPNWYNYIDQGVHGTDGKTSIWANAQTLDNSQFVWIPRYAYKITTTHTSTPSQIDVKFLIGTTDKYMKDGVEASLPAGYIVHPGFTFGSDKLTGIWVAKYEASNNNGKVISVQNKPSWVSIPVASIFDTCFTMATDPTYGFTGLTNGNTHMMKNSEWGAIAYLTHSKYGRNGNEITINSVGLTTAGGNAVTNINQSTTGNISGIYDISGGAWEYVAANLNSNLASAGTATNFNAVWNSKGEKAKYFEIYDGYNEKIKGDAIWETSSSCALNSNTSWFDGYSNFAASGHPWFGRGGNYCTGALAGAFSFGSNEGTTYDYDGFRPVFFAL